jgi:hypothetical protein
MDFLKANHLLGKAIAGFQDEEITDFVLEFDKIDDPEFEAYQEATRTKSNRIRVNCLECGHKFSRNIGSGPAEIDCPECGSYETDIIC